MKKLILYIFILSFACNVWSQPPAGLAYWQSHDFGIIRQGKVDTAVFRIYNRDTTPIYLGKWKAGCGCVRIEIRNKVIKPRHTDTVLFIYNSSGNSGYVERYVNIDVVNNQPEDSIMLFVSGYVLPGNNKITLDTSDVHAIRFYNLVHDFGLMPEGPELKTQYRFLNTSAKPVQITNCQSSCGCVVPSWPKEPIMPGQEAAITVVYNTSSRIGTFQKNIMVYFSNGQYVVLTIKGEVQAPVSFDNQAINLGTLPPDTVVMYKFKYHIRSSDNVHIVSVEHSKPEEAVVTYTYPAPSVHEDDPGITVTFNTHGRKGFCKDALLVRFSTGDYYHLAVEAYVRE